MVVEVGYSEGLWQQIVQAKYFCNQTVATVKACFLDSPCWKSILKVKHINMEGRKLVLNSGNLIRLWHDPWLGSSILKKEYPILFDICNNQKCTVACFVADGCSLSFRRRLTLALTD